VRAIELEMADGLGIDPVLWMPIRHQKMLGRDGLGPDAVHATPQQSGILLVVRRDHDWALRIHPLDLEVLAHCWSDSNSEDRGRSEN